MNALDIKEIRNQRALEESTGSIFDINNRAYPRSKVTAKTQADIALSGAVVDLNPPEDNPFDKDSDRMASYLQLCSNSVDSSTGARIRVAYRLVSYLSIVAGLKAPTVPLYSIANIDERLKPWTNNPVYGAEHIREAVDCYVMDYGGFPLFPPEYNENDDSELDDWCAIYQLVAEFIRADISSSHLPGKGVEGLTGLTDTDKARYLWPASGDLMAFEVDLIFNLYDEICSTSTAHCERRVMEIYAYSRSEAVALVRIALKTGNAIYEDEFDSSLRIRELKALEMVAGQARLSQNSTAMIAALKQRHVVLGLAKEAQDRGFESLREGARQVLDGDEPLMMEEG